VVHHFSTFCSCFPKRKRGCPAHRAFCDEWALRLIPLCRLQSWTTRPTELTSCGPGDFRLSGASLEANHLWVVALSLSCWRLTLKLMVPRAAGVRHFSRFSRSGLPNRQQRSTPLYVYRGRIFISNAFPRQCHPCAQSRSSQRNALCSISVSAGAKGVSKKMWLAAAEMRSA
jgi:hypothetical protein